MAITVLLVEDTPELRSVLRQSLNLHGSFAVVAEAADGAGAIIAAARHQPDVVVLDLGLPDFAGHEVLRRLRAVSPAAQIVVYTGSYTADDESSLTDEVEAFLTKDRDVAYLVDLLARLSRPRHDTAAVELGPGHRDVAIARHFISDRSREWGCADLVDDAQVVVSELVTNALIHGAPRCELRISLSDAALRVQVIDFGSGMPDPQAASQRDEHGRGLVIVSALCAAWGVEILPAGGKVVWAELLRPLLNPGDASRPGRHGDELTAGPGAPPEHGAERGGNGAVPPLSRTGWQPRVPAAHARQLVALRSAR